MKKLALMTALMAVTGLDAKKENPSCVAVALDRIETNATAVIASKDSSKMCKENCKKIKAKVKECRKESCVKTGEPVCTAGHMRRIEFNAKEALRCKDCSESCKEAFADIQGLAMKCEEDCKANCSKDMSKKAAAPKKKTMHKKDKKGEPTKGHAGHADDAESMKS